MRHKVISTSAIMNLFNIAVQEHVREPLGEKHPDIVGRVNRQGHQNGLSVLRFLPLSVRQEQPDPSAKEHAKPCLNSMWGESA